ncbi:MAG: Slp family lipoprotein [Gammaproteobacteria bacterium]
MGIGPLSSLFIGSRFGRPKAGAAHDFPVRPALFHAWLKAAFGIVLIALTCSGCGAPAPLRGGPYLGLTPREVMARGSAHDRVRWGGKILERTARENTTCFQILAYHLDRHARPWKTGGDQGSFIACAPGFYDPTVYEPGRMLTVVGRLQQQPRHGEQRLVLVSAEKIYLWHGWEGKWELRSCD